MTIFQGFSPYSFEQFIRTLALQVLGPGVTVFGRGPDGGRDACFRGTVPYPFPPAEQWSGYGVIQAKFKQRLETTLKDQSWAAAQLKAELARWQENADGGARPEYYIFCTNVELTSANRGGRSRVEDILNAAARSLPLKDFRIWDATQLRSYVDRYESIRSRFSCFFTTGDLLARFAANLAWKCNPQSILTAFLCRELLHDEDARLSQAGDRSEDRIKLADVFIDLRVAGPAENHRGPFPQIPNSSLEELAAAAAGKLDPLTMHELHGTRGAQGKQRGRPHARFLLLGAPGSGKSTIGQFLSQMHRAAFLDRRPEHRLESRVRNIIDAMKARCQDSLVDWPSTPRFPLRIELNDFAQALAAEKDKVETLSEYIRGILCRDERISHSDLRSWLSTYPWLIFFDGLDEVPASSNRRQVVAAIQHFLNEARDVEADLLVIASTRPEGYHGELDGEDVATRTLQPLRVEEALAYAQRYLNAKSRTDDDSRSAALLATIAEAIEAPLVGHLMTSPLQVTFMIAVIAASGRPSESRWQLFTDYYRTIYERELHKAVRPFSRVLSERRQDVDALHYRVGYLLQARGEVTGGVEAALAHKEFEALVDASLLEDGLNGDELGRQRSMIIDAARLRLVILTSRKPGRLSFDVRSLQEYMAATYLTEMDADEIVRRLKVISHSAYWRNTLLFAIGRFFVEPRMRAHRDKIRLLCEDLNRDGPLHSSAKSGSRLALDILASGVVGNVPHISRSLAECALKLLELLPSNDNRAPARLASIYDECMQPEFYGAIVVWLGQREFQRALSAWLLLLCLEDSGVHWARELAAASWPSATASMLPIIELWYGGIGHGYQIHDELTDVETRRLETLLPRLSLRQCHELVSQRIRPPPPSNNTCWVRSIHRLFALERVLELSLTSPCGKSLVELSFVQVRCRKSIRAAVELRSELRQTALDESWRQLEALLEFIAEPNASSLASSLLALYRLGDKVDRQLCAQVAPWPLACCLASGPAQHSLVSLANMAASGRFGCIELWTQAETRWKESGISMSECTAPLHHSSLPLIGGIVAAESLARSVSLGEEATQALLTLVEMLPSSWPRQKLTQALATHALLMAGAREFDISSVRAHLVAAVDPTFRAGWWLPSKINDTSLDFYAAIGLQDDLMSFAAAWRISGVPIDEVLLAFVAQPDRTGLLRCGLAWLIAGEPLEQDTLSVLAQDDAWTDHRWAQTILRICTTDLSREQALALANDLPSIIAACATPTIAIEMLLGALEKRAHVPTLLPVLIAAGGLAASARWELLADAEEIKHRYLLAHPTEIATLEPLSPTAARTSAD